MKRLILAASALALLSAAPAAFAQVTPATGTVTVTGFVGTKCVVLPGGTGSSFSDTIALGELDQADGTLDPAKVGSAGTPSGSVGFRIACNGSDANIDFYADARLHTGTGTETSGNGYSKNIDYTGRLDTKLADATTAHFYYTTAASMPGHTTGALGQRLFSGAGNNITVSVYSLSPENGATSVLDAGSYTSTMHITITPVT